MHGGTAFDAFLLGKEDGLSPRARGNRAFSPIGAIGAGSIPACTGEPTTTAAPRSCGSVYPRVHGGTRVAWDKLRGNLGLSPRARGNRLHLPRYRPERRSIPACTGEPVCAPHGLGQERVYPRVHGGTGRTTADFSMSIGLSPRARGNRWEEYIPLMREGSIPACTGEPTRRAPTGSMAKVYPRVHGGTERERDIVTDATGLSPRARGNHRPCSGESHRGRSIPACTGEPWRWSV